MTKATLVSFLRTFTIQGSWNYERLVGLGLAFSLEPLVRDLGREGSPRYRESLARAAGFFNTHPYLAGLAAGALARAERDGATPQQIDRLRTALVAPLGSVGDGLVWAGWLPFCSAVGLAVTALVSPPIGIVLFLLIYNAVHLALRYWGVAAGWREGIRVATALGHPVIQRGLALTGPAAACGIGFALPVVGVWLAGSLPDATRVGVLMIFLAGVVVGRWLVPALGGTRVGMAMVAMAALVAVVWR